MKKHPSITLGTVLVLLAAGGCGLWFSKHRDPEAVREERSRAASRLAPAAPPDWRVAAEREQREKTTKLLGEDGSALRTARDFLAKYDSTDATLSGSELRQARFTLSVLAAGALTLDQLMALGESVQDRVYYGDIASAIAGKLAREDPERGMRWLLEECKTDGELSFVNAYAFARQFDAFPADDLARLTSDKAKCQFLVGVALQAGRSPSIIRETVAYLQDHPEVNRWDGSMVARCFEPSLRSGDFKEALGLWSVLKDDGEREPLLRKIFETASSKNPAQALELLGSVQGESERATAIRGTAGSWAESQPEKVAAWANSLPTASEQDAAKEGLALSIIHNDPTSALEWARSIRDEKRRDAAVAKVMQNLESSSPGRSE